MLSVMKSTIVRFSLRKTIKIFYFKWKENLYNNNFATTASLLCFHRDSLSNKWCQLLIMLCDDPTSWAGEWVVMGAQDVTGCHGYSPRSATADYLHIAKFTACRAASRSPSACTGLDYNRLYTSESSSKIFIILLISGCLCMYSHVWFVPVVTVRVSESIHNYDFYYTKYLFDSLLNRRKQKKSSIKTSFIFNRRNCSDSEWQECQTKVAEVTDFGFSVKLSSVQGPWSVLSKIVDEWVSQSLIRVCKLYNIGGLGDTPKCFSCQHFII